MEHLFLSSFTVMALVALLGAISPGPDFFIVTKNSLTYSRRTGVYTALGVALGVWVHLTYCLVGVGFFIRESFFLFTCIKYSGAAYLIYIGLKSMQTPSLPSLDLDASDKQLDLTRFKALQSGFLTNALNPKATLFFLSVFSQIIHPDTSVVIQLVYALEIWVISGGWFCSLAFLLSHHSLKSRLLRIQKYIEKSMGLLLIAFGLKIAFI